MRFSWARDSSKSEEFIEAELYIRREIVVEGNQGPCCALAPFERSKPVS